MTHYWWMHWFWITCQLTLCLSVLHSIPVPESSVRNRPQLYHRATKSISESNVQTPSLTVPFPSTSDTSDISLNEPFAHIHQKYKTNVKQNEKQTTTRCHQLNQSQNQTVNTTTTATTTTTNLITNNTTNTTSSSLISCNNSNSVINNQTANDFDANNSAKNDSIEDASANTNVTNGTLVISKELVSITAAANHNAQPNDLVDGDDDGNISTVSTSSSSLNAASITGISFGVLVLAAFIGVSSFLLYRRRYLNKPQTLNDKCSNPDSSGYIDDSTMRENSEEMYSLDNDSFLNSLEAMTIQNYWTDTVKHTKL